MDNIISPILNTCADINEYYRTSNTFNILKTFICKRKYNKLKKIIDNYKESTTFIDSKCFYTLLSKLYMLSQIERKEYNCLSITLGNDDNYSFIFEFKLDGLKEDSIEYYGIVTGTSSIDNISIVYTLIASNKEEKINLGNYTEDTRELIDSLVLLKESNGNSTTLSYKMIYCQNYFAKISIDNTFKFIDDNINKSEIVIKEKI